MKSTFWLRTIGRITLAGTILLGATIPLSGSEASAAIMDNIRVALFMNHSKSSIESSITLSTTNGFDIGIRNDRNTIEYWLSDSAEQIRSVADGYGVQLLLTDDPGRAGALADSLSKPPEKAQVYAESKQGKTIYRVVYGHFMDASEAMSARDKVVRDGAVADLMSGYSPIITGTMRLTSGAYQDKASADKLQDTIAKAGLSASVVMVPGSSGKANYQVWVGNEPDKASLTKLQSDAAKLIPNISLSQANTDIPYVMLKSSFDYKTDDHLFPQYVFGANTKLWVHSKQQNGITVKERSERTYRGDFELSLYNNDLAAVNEIPFEQYLYSVVGTEMGGSYPVEALKAQAVIARTYAMTNGNTYDIANVVDNTFDQAYYGMGNETDSVIEAVNATKDEIIVDQSGNPIAAFYSASAGGRTAHPSEVWGSSAPNMMSVQSPDNGVPEQWYRVLLDDNRVGYVKGSYVKDTGKRNAADFAYYTVTENGLNVRTSPTMNSLGTVITKLNTGDQVIVLESIVMDTPYVWERSYSASALSDMLNQNGTKLNGPLTSLEITSRGQSGRVTEMQANGQVVNTKSPDYLRTVLGSLPSTLFDIVDTGSYTIQGASSKRNKTGNTPVYTLSGSSNKATPTGQSQYYVLGGTEGSVRAVTTDTNFLFKGKGYGHGLGLSQYGARNYALQGYTYQQIIQAYFNGVRITKG
ncbi:SpoIID/LytB domain-containing protein [Paenibacillus albiflavus]|uniref:SpoIID/LytB domain-containing protein n=1 Tax=Paenibacillus albiflavus TaxID=2545760 RepID=UPI00140493E8|nr:SpoIID/LytB domain-containing protein [Paenibacillus albiflavus]